MYTWTWQHCFDKLRQVYEKAGVDKAKAKIFNAKPAEKPVGVKATQQPLKPHEASPETPLEGPLVEHVETVQRLSQEIERG